MKADTLTRKAALAKHTVLHLNNELLSGYADRDWDESRIREGGVALAKKAASIWVPADQA